MALASTEIRNPIVLSRQEWIKVLLIYVAIAVATGFGIYLTFWVGTQYAIFWPLGVLAYTLGLRHGVDADHICVIDNTTRKLIQQDKRPTTVGTWFSLGHSTIVVAMLGLLVIASRFIESNLPAFEADGAVLGTIISGGFLYVIALINFLIFWQVYLIYRELRTGQLDQKKLDALGFAGVMRPVSTTCTDHMGSAWARIHTWDGTKWNISSDWYQADEEVLNPMVKAAADKYASDKQIARRTPEDCQS